MENDLEIETLQSELQSLVSVPPFSEEELEQDDDRCKFYTGLPNYKLLKAVFDLVVVPSMIPIVSISGIYAHHYKTEVEQSLQRLSIKIWHICINYHEYFLNGSL